MTVAELAKNLNKTANLSIEHLTIGVTIIDARESFGRLDYLVSPTAGLGQQWVSESRVTPDEY